MEIKEFEQKLESNKLLFIDMFATWCGPCKMMMPIVEEIREDLINDQSVEILTIDIDENPEIPAKYNIMSVPTFIFIKEKNVKDMIVGATTREAILEKINQYK